MRSLLYLNYLIAIPQLRTDCMLIDTSLQLVSLFLSIEVINANRILCWEPDQQNNRKIAMSSLKTPKLGGGVHIFGNFKCMTLTATRFHQARQEWRNCRFKVKHPHDMLGFSLEKPRFDNWHEISFIFVSWHNMRRFPGCRWMWPRETQAKHWFCFWHRNI